MNELSHHLAFTTPSILPDPAIGTRLSFRLLFPDTRASANSSAVQAPKYMVKDLGSIVIGDGGPGLDLDDPTNPRNINQAGADSDDANKTLADARFVTGDYISVAILPPLGDGSVAPASAARMGRGAGAGEAGTVVGRAPGALAGERENGFGGRRGGRARRPESSSRGGGFGVPFGEWRRGERLPEVSRGGRAPPAERRRGDGPSEPSYSRSRGRGRY